MSTGNMGDILRQAGRMRRDMEKVQEELKERYVEASAGEGLVEVMLNGQQEVVKISIDPEFFKDVADKVEVDLLEDLLLAALSQGVEKSKALMKTEMEQVSGGLGGLMPGLF
jgi:DNA-binding YbaB/EbfC family protein